MFQAVIIKENTFHKQIQPDGKAEVQQSFITKKLYDLRQKRASFLTKKVVHLRQKRKQESAEATTVLPTAVVEDMTQILTPSTSSPVVLNNHARPLPGACANISHYMVELCEAAGEDVDGKLKKNALGPVVKVRLKLIIMVTYCFCNQR